MKSFYYTDIPDKRLKKEKIEIPVKNGAEIRAYTYTPVNAEKKNCPCIIFYHFEVKTDNITYYYGNNTDMLGGCGEVYDDIKNKLETKTIYVIARPDDWCWINEIFYSRKQAVKYKKR